jgi:hypothetical protein
MSFDTSHKSRIRTINMNDSDFMLQDGYIISPRAGLEIDKSCPREYRMIITECLNNGWLKPVAYVKDNELFWEEFEK